jgi:energy-coupling factor transporter ATP-binding protein EcfA2
MAKTKLSLSVNFKQAANSIVNVGTTNTLLFMGQPGVGKSSLLPVLQEALPNYGVAYVDVANLDLGDLGMPVIDKDRMLTSYAPSTRFGIEPGSKRPLIVMLDELGKASRPVMNMLLPVILEHRLGDVMLPPGSIVFATTNLATDGVGDNIPAHAYNRMTVIDFANPTVDEWLSWAATADIAPEVMAFAKQFPQVFDRYDAMEKDDKNPYIFNPKAGQTKCYCSPRSLAKASNVIKAREALGEALVPLLAGTVGESAARDMEALVNLTDQLPSYESIVKKPGDAKLPTSIGAYFLSAFMLAGRVKQEDLDSVMEYVGRWTNFEATTLFASTIAANPNKVGWACGNRNFVALAAKLGKFF